MKEMIPLSLRQRKAFVWWARREYEDYAAIICDGAIRSGKTLAMGMGFFFWAMACFSDRQFALCGRSVGALRRNLLETVLPQLRRLGFACEEKRSEKLLIVRRRGRENRFYLFGGANEASAALIQGMTLAGVLFDEAALMPRSFVEQASARCSVEGSRLWFSCNPEGPNHWFYREWVCRAEEKRALYLHFTMEDNPSLSARVRARYESMYSGIFYRRFVLGEWTAAEGRISALESGKADKTELAAQIRALSQSHEADTAALRSENCWVRLGEWSVTEESSLISLSFPEIDKSRFRQLRLHFHICGVSALGNVILRMNQVSSGQYDTGGINRTDGLYLSFTNSLFAAGFAEWFFIPGAADRLPCHVWYCSKAVMNGSDRAALVGADWESLSSVQFVPKDGTLCAPGSEFALYGLKR